MKNEGGDGEDMPWRFASPMCLSFQQNFFLPRKRESKQERDKVVFVCFTLSLLFLSYFIFKIILFILVNY